MNWRNRTKLKLIEYKGGKCEKCGLAKPTPAIYDFHHKNPASKDFTVSGKSWSFDKLKAEVDKCILVCKNCHAEIHWEQEQSKRVKRLEVQRVPLLSLCCDTCGIGFQQKHRDMKYCSQKCYAESQRRVTRPSRAQLVQDIKSMTWVAIGEKYGVSDNAVRKWARYYDIPM